jgi:hypothetical protein
MSRFPLKEATLTIRDTEVRVRELTHAQRSEWSAATSVDSRRGAPLIASMGTVDPPMTENEATAEPGEVIGEIVEKIMEISGMRQKKGAAQKEPDAR